FEQLTPILARNLIQWFHKRAAYAACLFFFSSRRRHTRWPRDWSSDVCSSDLDYALKKYPFIDGTRMAAAGGSYGGYMADWIATRSEERRVGKEWGSRWWAET